MKDLMIEVKNVKMKFKMSDEPLNSLKEIFTKAVTGKLKFNPLYHFIGCMRKCLIDGVSPEPINYVYCLIFALGSLAIGSYIFKKCQDKFTLYL